MTFLHAENLDCRQTVRNVRILSLKIQKISNFVLFSPDSRLQTKSVAKVVDKKLIDRHFILLGWTLDCLVLFSFEFVLTARQQRTGN